LTPVTAEEEPLDIDIDIEFLAFYEVNISGALAKNIGVAGLSYPVTVNVSSAGKEVNLTNRYLEVRFNYRGLNTQNQPIFSYKKHFIRSITLIDKFSLAKELKNGECSRFQFNISFLETGWYVIEWREILGNEEMEEGEAMFISITGPMEYENLLKQAQVLDAQKKSAEASEKSAKASEKTANATKWLAIVTAALAFFTFVTVTQIRKDREVDLLRRRLGNLYSMLKRNKDILNQKPALDSRHAKRHAKYVLWMAFYTKFKENLYLASDELVLVAEKFLEYIDLNRVPEEKEKEFFEIRRNLIEQIDSDYDKYLKLLKLTEKLALSHFLLKITRFLDGAKKLLKLTKKPKK
jgi:hypothetical protein